MTSHILRHPQLARKAMLSPDQLIDAAACWRSLERINWTVAQHLLAGRSRKEIAVAMKWDRTSVNSFLNQFRKELHWAGIRKEATP
jgi:hypothetical protein